MKWILLLLLTSICYGQGAPIGTTPRIALGISKDFKTASFSCLTGVTCPVQFGLTTVADGTPKASLKIVSIPGGRPTYVLFALTNPQGGLRIGGAVTVSCGSSALPACLQDGNTALAPGELAIASAWAWPADSTWRNATDAWTTAYAYPVINLLGDDSAVCSSVQLGANITFTCTTNPVPALSFGVAPPIPGCVVSTLVPPLTICNDPAPGDNPNPPPLGPGLPSAGINGAGAKDLQPAPTIPILIH